MRTVGIGVQDFEKIINQNLFYVDKTKFIKEWWENGDEVTLITRPRRFGKTLTMSMVESFFSNQYARQSEIFEGLEIWSHEEYRELQGTYPVINLSFANVKETDFETAKMKIYQLLVDMYNHNHFLMDEDFLLEQEKKFFQSVTMEMPEYVATAAIHKLSEFLCRYYGKKVIILLDEYDTPMQEAYLEGYWDELVKFTRGLFHSTFKTNPYLERGLLTGITRVNRESVFSDLNNLDTVTMTSDKYADIFGFTEQEVFAAMDEMELQDKEDVKKWYDGYVIGESRGIYNPWSVINYLQKGKLNTYWANSSNALVGKLVREGSSGIKIDFECLLRGETINAMLDEEIVFSQLDENEDAIWSLLLALGYLKVVSTDETWAELKIVNYEVLTMFEKIVYGWFHRNKSVYHNFIRALLEGDVEDMNYYLNEISEQVFSYFDTQQREAERFYHGFVLGLLVQLKNDYVLTSNRESGRGRYDVMIEPKDRAKEAIIIEFKAVRRGKDQALEDVLKEALAQIEEKNYERDLLARGFPEDKIQKYGFVFDGKKVLVGAAD